ncbi:hypothetical protein ACQY0O_007646 [Thecaphora frezii]
MSYQQPHDTYMHSNASQYDERYQQGGYSDYPDNSGGGAYGGSNTYGQNAATNAAATYSYAKPKKGFSKWLKFGVPIAILIIIGAVVGGVIGSRSSSDDDSSSSSKSSVGKGSTSGVDSATLSASQQAAKQGGNNQLFYQGTDAYGNPSFVTSQVNTAAPSTSGKQHNSTCTDSFTGGSLTNLRAHPRIIAPKYEWDCLPTKIANDAYLTLWNETIFSNATKLLTAPVTNYSIDGGFTGSGILDVSREIQQRVKTWAYAYKISGDDRYKTRLFQELNAAAGNSNEAGWSASHAANAHWNPAHFLDVAEMTSAFAIAYDWLYDDWSQDQRHTILGAIVNYGLVPGQDQYNTGNGWWKTTDNGNGNWNCVCNGGLLTGALAIRGDGNSTENTIADDIINKALQNMKDNCMRGVYSDGTWSETPNYWYFGTNAHARALASLISATGSDQGLMAQNPNWYKTNDFHMYVSGMAGMFFYGDHGPNKFATTANQLMLYSKLSGNPRGALFQRDRADASFDPLSMFWYDPASVGAFWNGLALDKFFDNDDGGQWASMRSSWTDFNGVYVGIKASNLTAHQTHGDLDAGTFVIDALGTRWAGELGSGNYLSQDYFSNETASSARWTYYRTATQGQNTLVINDENQAVASCLPVNKFETTGPSQDASLDYTPGTNDVAYFVSDLSTCYSLGQGVVQRGIRMLNGRRQVLVRDEIAQSSSVKNIKWRVHTNGTVTLSSDGRTATLKISQITDPNAGVVGTVSIGGEKTMVAKILSPANARFTTNGPPATRIYGQAVASPAGEDSDQVNTGVTALQIEIDDTSDATTIEVVWQPQWSDLTDADKADPKSVSLSLWSLTSHNA